MGACLLHSCPGVGAYPGYYSINLIWNNLIGNHTTSMYIMYGTLSFTGSATTVGLMGVAYFANIHHLWYFIIVQMFGGLLQVSIVCSYSVHVGTHLPR